MKTAAGGEVVSALPPITKSPDTLILILVPATVTAGPPAFTAVPAISKDIGFGVIICPAIVSIAEL